MRDQKRQGRAWAFGDGVSIEYISPLRYMFNAAGRGAACLTYLDPIFASTEKDGDIIVAGSHFGQGPGHDHAVLAIREAGIAGVVARSFAPQFYRHAVVHGLLVAECVDILDLVRADDELMLDFANGIGRNLTNGAEIRSSVPQGPAARIVQADGLIPFLRAELSDRAASTI